MFTGIMESISDVICTLESKINPVAFYTADNVDWRGIFQSDLGLQFDAELISNEFEPTLDRLPSEYFTEKEIFNIISNRSYGGIRAAIAMERRQNKIKRSWRKFRLLFPKTAWKNRDSVGPPLVACMDWVKETWRLDSTVITCFNSQKCRFVCV